MIKGGSRLGEQAGSLRTIKCAAAKRKVPLTFLTQYDEKIRFEGHTGADGRRAKAGAFGLAGDDLS